MKINQFTVLLGMFSSTSCLSVMAVEESAAPAAGPVKNAYGQITEDTLSKGDLQYNLQHQPGYQSSKEEGENQNVEEFANILVSESESDSDDENKQLKKKSGTIGFESDEGN